MKLIQGDCLEIGKRISRQEALRISQETLERSEMEREIIDMGPIGLHLGECKEVMKYIPDNSVDLTVTSPPYDNLRTYNGYVFDFEGIAKELYRVTKTGGVVVWVVGDATIKGSETGTSLKQALYFKDVCGFNLHDTMIYSKGAQGGAKGSKYCYTQSFEYMFVFSKGKPKSLNLLKDHKNAYLKTGESSMRRKQGHTVKFMATGNTFSKRTNVWEVRGGYMVGTTDKIAFEHPATFPEQLVHDHIISWSNEGDTVLDPMMGSGTTGKMARILNRKFIGIEISTEYFAIATRRIEDTDPLFQVVGL